MSPRNFARFYAKTRGRTRPQSLRTLTPTRLNVYLKLARLPEPLRIGLYCNVPNSRISCVSFSLCDSPIRALRASLTVQVQEAEPVETTAPADGYSAGPYSSLHASNRLN